MSEGREGNDRWKDEGKDRVVRRERSLVEFAGIISNAFFRKFQLDAPLIETSSRIYVIDTSSSLLHDHAWSSCRELTGLGKNKSEITLQYKNLHQEQGNYTMSLNTIDQTTPVPQLQPGTCSNSPHVTKLRLTSVLLGGQQFTRPYPADLELRVPATISGPKRTETAKGRIWVTDHRVFIRCSVANE
jgi:hypothetical protein